MTAHTDDNGKGQPDKLNKWILGLEIAGAVAAGALIAGLIYVSEKHFEYIQQHLEAGAVPYSENQSSGFCRHTFDGPDKEGLYGSELDVPIVAGLSHYWFNSGTGEIVSPVYYNSEMRPTPHSLVYRMQKDEEGNISLDLASDVDSVMRDIVQKNTDMHLFIDRTKLHMISSTQAPSGLTQIGEYFDERGVPSFLYIGCGAFMPGN